MQRLVMWMALACLALTAGVFAFYTRGSEDSVPMIALVPATPIARADERPEAQRSEVRPDDASHGSRGERADTGADATAADVRPAQLEVELRHTLGDTTPVLAPFRDVDLSVDGPGDEKVTARAQTDDRGVARFQVPAGDRRIATVSSGPSATGTVLLRGGQTVRTVLVVAARVVVHGAVVDEAGTPIADAELVVLPWVEATGQTPRPRRVGRSGKDGSFSIGLGAGGRLGALHAGFAPSAMYGIPPAADPTQPPEVHTVRLVLSTNFATLDVRVADARGKAVARAEVEVRSAGDVPRGAVLLATPQRHVTDDDGRTTFVVRPGKLDYVARRPGHATARGGGEVLPGRTATLEIRLQQSCGVHGYVQTKDGVRVANARVWSNRGENGEFVVTNAEGAFRLDDVPPGVHELRAREGSSFAARAEAQRTSTRIELAPGEIANWVAVLEPPPDDTFLRGDVVDTEGRPLANCRVYLRAAGRSTKTVADERGAFRGERPAPGPIDALVYAPETPLGAFATAVLLGLDADSGPLHLVVDRGARTTTLVGRVVSLEQAPLPATIVCYHLERRETARFQARADGVIDVPRVPPGLLDVHVEHPTKAAVVKRQLRAEPDVPLDLGLLVLGSAATLHGKLTGPGGAVPESAVVALQAKDQRIVGEYAAGTYRFDSVPAGQHVLQVQGAGLAAANFVVRLTAGVDLEQNIELRTGVPRRITVRLPGIGQGNVALALRAPGEAHTWLSTGPLRGDTPDAREVAAEFVAWMAPGTYEAIAWCGEAFEARATIVFVVGDDTPVTMLLQPR